MPSQPAPMHTPEQIANLEAAKAAHARGELVQFRGIKGSPYKWCIYDAPFTWEKCYEYRPAPKPNNTPWRIMPQGEETRENCMDVLRVEDADGNLVFRASEVTHKQASPLERAYAEHIVKCVNHHAALLAALQKIAKERDQLSGTAAMEFQSIARAAISAAQANEREGL